MPGPINKSLLEQRTLQIPELGLTFGHFQVHLTLPNQYKKTRAYIVFIIAILSASETRVASSSPLYLHRVLPSHTSFKNHFVIKIFLVLSIFIIIWKQSKNPKRKHKHTLALAASLYPIQPLRRVRDTCCFISFLAFKGTSLTHLF